MFGVLIILSHLSSAVRFSDMMETPKGLNDADSALVDKKTRTRSVTPATNKSTGTVSIRLYITLQLLQMALIPLANLNFSGIELEIHN